MVVFRWVFLFVYLFVLKNFNLDLNFVDAVVSSSKSHSLTVPQLRLEEPTGTCSCKYLLPREFGIALIPAQG